MRKVTAKSTNMFLKVLLKMIFSALLFLAGIYSAYSQAQSSSHMDEVIKLIKRNYVDSVNIDSIIHELVTNFLNRPSTMDSVFARLDPHTAYLNPQDYRQFKQNLNSNIEGIGIIFTIVHDTAFVVKTFKNGPAEKSGLKAGDKIIKIDDNPVYNKNLVFDDVVYKLIGKKGTHVKLLVQRNNPAELIPFDIIRDSVGINTVLASYIINKGIGYILISHFAANTVEEVKHSLEQLKALGMKKLILDLRDNPGGLMGAAINIADEFLSAGKLIVFTKGRSEDRDNRFSKNSGLFENGQMVVLVNESSASASEVLAGAIQDNKRAIIIGRRTYGKGFVQKLYPLSDSASALKLTIARYYTPSGKCIQRPFNKGYDAYTAEYNERVMNNGGIQSNIQTNSKIEWGIEPDMYVADDSSLASKLFSQLIYRQYIQQFAYYFYAGNVSIAEEYKNPDDFKKHFVINNQLFDSFKKFIAELEIKITEDKEKLKYTSVEIDNIRPRIELALKAYIARGKWMDEGLYYILNEGDADINAGLKQLNAPGNK